jgi:plastocyanin
MAKSGISFIVVVIIVVVLVIAFAAGYFAGTGTGRVTQYQTVTQTTTTSAAPALNPTCVTLGNCPESFVYIAYGASTSTSSAVNPGSITVMIGTNNTVTWENLDTISQTIVGQNNLFNSQSIAPGHSFSYTFTTPGTFTYSGGYPSVKGTVTVLAAATTSAPGSNPDDNY